MFFCLWKSGTSCNSMAYKIHIGQHIREQFDKRGCTVSWLARQINCHRTNIYGIFRRETIDVKLLYKIGQALEYDFFLTLSEQIKEKQ